MTEKRDEKLDATRQEMLSRPHSPQIPDPLREREDRDILRQRARDLARGTPPTEARQKIAVVEFALGRERLAIPSESVKEVFFLRRLVPVPRTPAFIAGIVNLRGTILSVVDLRPVLGIESLPDENLTSVLRIADEEMEFGLLTRRVEGAREISRRQISPPPATLSGKGLIYLRGVLPGPVSLIDARRLLADPEMRVEERENEPT